MLSSPTQEEIVNMPAAGRLSLQIINEEPVHLKLHDLASLDGPGTIWHQCHCGE